MKSPTTGECPSESFKIAGVGNGEGLFFLECKGNKQQNQKKKKKQVRKFDSLTDRLTPSVTDRPLNAVFLRDIFFFVVAVAYSQLCDLFSMAADNVF